MLISKLNIVPESFNLKQVAIVAPALFTDRK